MRSGNNVLEKASFAKTLFNQLVLGLN